MARPSLLKSVSREIELVLVCARARLSPEHVQRIEELVSQGVGWSEIQRLADQHGILPLLYRHVSRELPELIEPDRLREIRALCERSSARNLIILDELRRVTGVLQSAAVSSIPLKGPLLHARIKI